MSLLDELNPICPRGCGRTMDDCHEQEDGGECEGGELLRENERLKAERDEVRAHYERVLGESQRKESALEEAIRDKDVADQKLGHAETAIERLTAELAEAKRRECTALCTDVERDRDQLNIALAEAKRDAEQMRLVLAMHGGGADPEGVYVGTPGNQVRLLLAIRTAATDWRTEKDVGSERNLESIVDAYNNFYAPDSQPSELPSQAVVSEAVAHTVTVGTQLAEIEMRVAADKAVLEAAEALADIERDRSAATEDSSIWLESQKKRAVDLIWAVDSRRLLMSQSSVPSGPSTADGPEQTDGPEHLLPIITDRGFKWMPAINGTHHTRVVAYESSNASGPHIWVKASDEGIGDSQSAHLPLDAAVQFAEQIQYLAANHYQLQASSVLAQAEAGGNG